MDDDWGFDIDDLIPQWVYQEGYIWTDKQGNNHDVRYISDRYASNLFRFIEEEISSLEMYLDVANLEPIYHSNIYSVLKERVDP